MTVINSVPSLAAARKGGCSKRSTQGVRPLNFLLVPKMSHSV